jgi:hypothetical protein
MNRRVRGPVGLLVVGTLAALFTAGLSSASTASTQHKTLACHEARPLQTRLGHPWKRCAETRIVQVAAAKITNHQSWMQISSHFDTMKVEEARQVLDGVCYIWESSANAGRRWRVIACWQNAAWPKS